MHPFQGLVGQDLRRPRRLRRVGCCFLVLFDFEEVAFRDEFAPQNPDDESASVLLERIQAEREAVEDL